MLTISEGGTFAQLSSNTFLKGEEIQSVRATRVQAVKCGIYKIHREEIKLDNRSGGVPRYRVDIYGHYAEPFSYPWHICYSRAWDIRHYGIGQGNKEGIFGQFPNAEGEYDFIMEQLLAVDAGFADLPEPGFKIVVHVVSL